VVLGSRSAISRGAANARIVTPTLSGLAEKAAKSASAPVLLDHINDVIAAVEDEQLSEVVLVGHSYAGMLITAAAEKLRSRLKHLDDRFHETRDREQAELVERTGC